MSRPRAILWPGLVLLVAASALAQDVPEIEFETYELPNGLDVILHEDHSIPVVTVNVWYHVGSKNEKAGKTGFAHLFEHMMFQGSEHHDTDYFMPLEKAGGQVNGSTTEDRTNYWENVPSDRLELALWLESDRMGFLLPAMTQDKLDNQKDVVQNEKRQGENAPYAKARELLRPMLFADDHPYSHTVIGAMEDLESASLEDVSEFFKLYYAPNNASLCVAGDFDPATAKQLIEKYFGTIPPGRPVERMERWLPVLPEERRATAEDDVELPRLYYRWLTPAEFQPGDAEADLLCSILADGKTSRLYKRLVYDLEIAQDINIYQRSMELCSELRLEVTARSGVGLDEIERVVDEELAKVRERGVTGDELELARTTFETGFVRRLERVGGFGGKADLLNKYNVMTGDPGYLARDLQRYRDVTPRDVRAFAARYLDPGHRAVLHIVPQGSLAPAEVAVDRTASPESAGEPSFLPPEIRTATLASGLELYVVEKPGLPLVNVQIGVRSGWAADPAGKPGVAAMTADMLNEGTRGMDALEISEAARRIGANLGTNSFFDGSTVNLNVLKRHLDEGLALVGDMLLEPTFPQDELDRLRRDYLGRIQQESVNPQVIGFKLLQKRLCGEGHPYAQPYTGSGTAASLEKLTRDDLVAFHTANYRPNNAYCLVVGDITLDEAVRRLERILGKWERGRVDRPAFPAPHPAEGARICIVDRPGAQQSFIAVGQLFMRRGDPDFLPFEVMNTALGAQFISRINMNLREEKGFTYGSYAFPIAFRDAGMFLAFAPVHTQFTAEALQELLREIAEIRDVRPVAGQELEDCKSALTKGFPGSFETLGGISGELNELVANDLPLDDWRTYIERVRGMTAADMQRVARSALDPDALQIVVVGDRAEIEEKLAGLDLGEMTVLEAREL